VKSEKLDVNDKLMEEVMSAIKQGITRKLAAAREMIDHDNEVAGGIYTYAVEELGKLELLKGSQKTLDGYQIDYKRGFLGHNIKFEKAAKYLEAHNHSECIDIGGSFSKASLSDSFTLELETNTEARLGIFYVDFEIDDTGTNAKKVKAIPYVNKSSLAAAIDGMEDVMRTYN
jgi:hypothetical protein